MAGPLTGIRVLEFQGLGAVPFCGMMLADMGAELIRVDRVGCDEGQILAELNPLNRSRRSIAVDVKTPEGRGVILDLVERCDALLEGFRPGVMERLGLGPESCMRRNPRLVFGRLTGWGRHGPWAQAPGHDINYLALGGVLAHLGRAGAPPTAPLNLVGNFGGGATFLAFGVVCALLHSRSSGDGQVVDAAMIDGAALTMATYHSRLPEVMGIDQSEISLHPDVMDEDHHGTNMFDSGAHFYDVYECADGKYISIGAVEPSFYRNLLTAMELHDVAVFEDQRNRASWSHLKERLRAIFLTRTRDEWSEVLSDTDSCFAPVLTMSEAREHPHNRKRATFIEVDGVPQPGPSPRFGVTVPDVPSPPVVPGTHTSEVLKDLCAFTTSEIEGLARRGVVQCADLRVRPGK